MPESSSSLAAFAAANDAAAATASKLSKQAALAAYLRALSDEDLPRAARFASGRPFATTEERVLGISGAAVSAVILEMFSLEELDWWHRVTAAGEFGEAMARLWQEQVDPANPARFDPRRDALSLADLQQTWDALAAIGQQEKKRDLLRNLFMRIRSPREAAYAGKIIFSDLRTGVREGVLHAAIAEAFARELGAVRRAILLVGDVGEVALLAKHDKLSEARFRLFHPISFMLAGVVETAPEAAEVIARALGQKAEGRAQTSEEASDSEEAQNDQTGFATANERASGSALCPLPSDLAWLAEHKLDGIRAQIHKQGSNGPDGGARAALYTRTMDRADESFPEIVAQALALPGEWLLDGEIVPYDDATGTVLPFAMLQKRLGRKNLSQEIIKRYPCRYIAFDLLYRDGEVWLDRPLRDRRSALEDLLKNSSGLRFSSFSAVRAADEIELAFAEARRARNEGLVIKDPASPYTPGRRGGAWIKLKTHLPTLDVVVTAAQHGHGKRRNVLSDYTFGVWDRHPAEHGAQLVNVGKAYSGVTDAEIDQLTELFLSIQTGRFGPLYTVRPQVVFEVAFDAIQKSERHAGGFAMRFPRIKRIRWDRAPESADRIERVREIYEHEQNFNRSASGDADIEPVRKRKPKVAPEQPGLFE